MSKSNVRRIGLLGSATVLALLGAVSSAQAVETKFGNVDIVFDTTVSMGGSVRTADRNTAFLPEGNGGNVDPRVPNGGVDAVTLGLADTGGFTFLGRNTYQAADPAHPDNNDGSVNTDDGRLNFDSGDFIGATIKASHDLQLKWQNYTAFVRAIGFYDVVMNDHDVGERSQLIDQALGDVGRNYELLDAFVSADYTIADMPVNLRVGKQVINWGESTFILHGNNVFNPIDVGAFRRPGSEIKEALLPVNAIYGSISLPFDVSMAAYYALDWEPFELDPSGTPFSGTDVVELGSGLGGNEGRASFLSGSPLSGARRNCTPLANGNTGTFRVQQAFNALLPGSGLLAGGAGGTAGDPTVSTAGRLDCNDDNAFTGIFTNTINYQSFYTIGRNEQTKLGLVGLLSSEGYTREAGAGIVDFADIIQAKDDGQYGLSARYYAESLGGTEFSFYFQNYHSRLPFASEVVQGAPVLGIGVTGDISDQDSGGIGGRQLLPAGCGFTAAAQGSTAVANAQAAGTIGAVDAVGFGGDLINRPVSDPQNLLGTTALDVANINAALVGAGFAGLQLTANGAGSYKNVLNAMRLNCALAYYQSTASLVPFLFGLQVQNGAETLTANPDLGLLIEYPENIKIWGMSFNTTLFGWGVQGDFSYRPDAPFQVDTDALTIAGVWYGCSFQIGTPAAATFIGGPSGALTYIREADGSGAAPQCLSNSGIGQKISGVIENEMYTAQIGTTVTFTQSDWEASLLDADLGILVTEIGMVYVPGVDDRNDTLLSVSAANGTRPPQFQNTGCNGSNLGLGGLLGLDGKTIDQCRPTDISAGLVLLYRLDYNNAFDTGFVVTPQIAYSWDFTGVTPSPYGNYLEDRQSVNLGVTGTLNNNFRLGASYTNFFGGHINNKATDQDFASMTASYTF